MQGYVMVDNHVIKLKLYKMKTCVYYILNVDSMET